MAFEGFSPDRWDLLGGTICIVGMAVMMYAPRACAIGAVDAGA